MGQLLKLAGTRMLLGFLRLLAVSVLIFGAVLLLPGDLAQELLGPRATPEAIAALRAELGLDQPVVTRHLGWLGGALQGEFGTSMANGREIVELIGARLVNTLKLAAYAAGLAVPVSILLGLMAAPYRNTLFDWAVNLITLATISFPRFFVGYILILIFSAKLQWLPSIANIPENAGLGMFLKTAFLPSLTLTLVITAHMMRMTRAAIINLLALPYIEMARLKGMPKARVILRHALPNALAPIINVVALNLAYLIPG